MSVCFPESVVLLTTLTTEPMEPLKILVCEDEPLTALELKQRLENLGHVVVGTASSGVEAVSMARQHHPNLALMDVQLPGDLTGTQAADTLGKQLKIPSIFISGFSDPETVRRAHRAHPLAYLVKPISDQELQLAIEFGMAQHQLEADLRDELEAYSALLSRLENSDHQLTPSTGRTSPAERDQTTPFDELGTFVASVAHHLNNSLAGVLGYLEWLASSASLEGHQQRAVGSALEECYRQKLFIQKLLWASQQGPRQLTIERVHDVIEQAANQMERLKHPTVTIQTHESKEELAVCVDHEALTSALLGTMLFAQSLLESQGTISVTTASEYISPSNLQNPRAVSGSYVLITVQVTGRTLGSEELQGAFRPAQINDGDLHALSLALPVAHGVAHAHSGWVTVDSHPETGTSITIVLPRVYSQ
jgi:CheY-like chemotaxis protein